MAGPSLGAPSPALPQAVNPPLWSLKTRHRTEEKETGTKSPQPRDGGMDRVGRMKRTVRLEGWKDGAQPISQSPSWQRAGHCPHPALGHHRVASAFAGKQKS